MSRVRSVHTNGRMHGRGVPGNRGRKVKGERIPHIITSHTPRFRFGGGRGGRGFQPMTGPGQVGWSGWVPLDTGARPHEALVDTASAMGKSAKGRFLRSGVLVISDPHPCAGRRMGLVPGRWATRYTMIRLRLGREWSAQCDITLLGLEPCHVSSMRSASLAAVIAALATPPHCKCTAKHTISSAPTHPHTHTPTHHTHTTPQHNTTARYLSGA